MKIIIVPNETKDKDLLVTNKIGKKLEELGISYYVDLIYSPEFSTVSAEGCPKDADMIIVVGGDGSVIDASGLATKLDLPLLGVNMGKVGYLSEVEPSELDTLEKLKNGEYKVEERMLLFAEKIDRDGASEFSKRLAVNDVVISHDEYFGLSDMKVENSRGDSVRYRADGVIVSTPAGSTAYALSAGGPIISHNLDSITVTPVCPHSLFNRSIVYGADECISISNSARSPLNISIDGRLFSQLNNGEYCRIRKSEKRLKIVTFSENNMFTALFNKIKNLEE